VKKKFNPPVFPNGSGGERMRWPASACCTMWASTQAGTKQQWGRQRGRAPRVPIGGADACGVTEQRALIATGCLKEDLPAGTSGMSLLGVGVRRRIEAQI